MLAMLDDGDAKPRLSLTVVKVGGSYAALPEARGRRGGARRGRRPHGRRAGRRAVRRSACAREQQRIGFDDAPRTAWRCSPWRSSATRWRASPPRSFRRPSRAAISDALARGRVPVWLPLDLLDGVPELAGELGHAPPTASPPGSPASSARSRLVFLKRGSRPASDATARSGGGRRPRPAGAAISRSAQGPRPGSAARKTISPNSARRWLQADPVGPPHGGRVRPAQRG